jgi:hypothetical protein
MAANMKIKLKLFIEYEDMGWIHLAQQWVQFAALENR